MSIFDTPDDLCEFHSVKWHESSHNLLLQRLWKRVNPHMEHPIADLSKSTSGKYSVPEFSTDLDQKFYLYQPVPEIYLAQIWPRSVPELISDLMNIIW